MTRAKVHLSIQIPNIIDPMRLVATLLVLPACELVFPLRDTTDAAGDGALAICERGSEFGPGVPVPIAGVHSVEGARFNPSQDVAMLSLCPTEGGPQEIKDGCDLFQAPFLTAQQEFGLPSELGVSVDGAYDAYPTVTPDLGYILFGSDRGGQPELFAARAVNGSFSMATAERLDVGLPFANEPYIVGDGSRLYYAASPNALNWDLHRATGGPDAYRDFTRLPAVNTTDGEFAPVVDDDELELFFASNRGEDDDAALDIYTTSRTSTAVDFEMPRRVSQLSTDGIDWPLWLSPDRCSLYYINKPYLGGAAQIGTLYVSRRSP